MLLILKAFPSSPLPSQEKSSRSDVVVVVVAVVVDLYYTGGALAWTRQAPWYGPCGEAVCVVCRELATCVHASLALFAKSRSMYAL